MEHDNLKKDSDITAFDELTDEQLEAVLGGFVIDGNTYTTTFAASNLDIQDLFDHGGSTIKIGFSTGTQIGLDASGTTVYTKE